MLASDILLKARDCQVRPRLEKWSGAIGLEEGKSLFTIKIHPILQFLANSADQVLLDSNARKEKLVTFFKEGIVTRHLNRVNSASSFENLQSSVLRKTCYMHFSVVSIHKFFMQVL